MMIMLVMQRKRKKTKPRFIKYTIDAKDVQDQSLCRYDIGKATIECCYQLSKSKWGFLGGQPACLMYLQLIFVQPKNCRLDNATITLTFRGVTDSTTGKTKGPFPSPRVTDYFGPKKVDGDKVERRVFGNWQFLPNLMFPGGALSGVGGGRSTVITDSRTWKLRGHRLSVKDGEEESYEYRQVQWHLEENEFEHQSSHGDEFYGGVVFEHHEAIFNLDIQIEGKLRKSTQRLLYKSLKDSGRGNIIIEPMKGAEVSHDSLKSLAESLDKDMTNLNRSPIISGYHQIL